MSRRTEDKKDIVKLHDEGERLGGTGDTEDDGREQAITDADEQVTPTHNRYISLQHYYHHPTRSTLIHAPRRHETAPHYYEQQLY